MVKKKVGIAGYGIIGKRRRQYIDNNPHLQTIAVCDQNLENDNKPHRKKIFGFEFPMGFYNHF